MVSQQHERHGLLGHNDNDSRQRNNATQRLIYVMGAIMAVALIATVAKRTSKTSSSNEPAGHKHHHAPHESIVNFPIDLEGKHKKEKKHHHDDDDDDNDGPTQCEDGEYSKRTLKLAYELPFASLFQDTKGQTKFEASAVVIKDDYAYAVCDSSWALSKFNVRLQPFSRDNVQIGDPHREKEDSEYEALFIEDDTFYVIREAVKHNDGSYHAIVEELKVNDNDYDLVSNCTCGVEFEGDSKGFEGAVAVHDSNNTMTILALCEANMCSEKDKDKRGNGRITVMQKFENGNTCVWLPIRVLPLPRSANFIDYSAITMTDNGHVAIASQEDSQLWVGKLKGRNDDGTWDVANMKFDEDGEVYDFPKNHDCETVYCNIEGVHWINDATIMAVSDKMKGKGKQDFRCLDKDQSVHVFVIP